MRPHIEGAGQSNWTVLEPRQHLLPTPYASHALSANMLLGDAMIMGRPMFEQTSGPPFTVSSPVLVTNLNAERLGGFTAGQFWKLTGNAATIPGTNFLGTTDAVPLDLRVNNQTRLRLETDGTARLPGLLRSGTETGATEAPNPAGLVVRRINSTSTAVNKVVTRTEVLTLERDGTPGGLLVRYDAFPDKQTIVGTTVNSAGVVVGFCFPLNDPDSAGVVQLCLSSSNVVHLQLTFGSTFREGEHLTQVSLLRFPTDFYWSGTVTSTYNQ